MGSTQLSNFSVLIFCDSLSITLPNRVWEVVSASLHSASFSLAFLLLAWALQNCATLIRYVASTSVCILRCVVLAEWVFCLDHCTASLNSAFFRSIFAFWPPITLPQIVHQSPVRVVRMWCLVLVFEIKFQSHRPSIFCTRSGEDSSSLDY